MTEPRPLVDLGLRLASAASDKGVTLRDVDIMIGATPGYCSRLVNAQKKRMDLSQLAKIAKAVDVAYSWLLLGEEERVEVRWRARRREAPPPCPSTHEGMKCRRRTGHVSEHSAAGGTWKDPPAIVPDMSDPLLQFFAFDHLPPSLRAVSEPFAALAHKLVTDLPRNPERTVALRKLLESKDCAVRAMIWKDPSQADPQHVRE